MEELTLRFLQENSVQGDCQVWNSGESLIADLEKGYVPEILFLDIELAEANGVEVGKYIRETLKNDQMQIIYVSSKTSYAMELFQVHPYDFLVKPVTEERFFIILEKIISVVSDDTKRFTYENNGATGRVALGEILYFESRDKSIVIHLNTGELITYRGKLKNEAEKLPDWFVRVGQSFIVNIRYISQYRNREVVMLDQSVISVTAPYRDKTRQIVMKYLKMGGGMRNDGS